MRLVAALVGLMLATPALAQAPLVLEGSAAAAPWQRYPEWTKIRWDAYSTLANPQAMPPRDSSSPSIATAAAAAWPAISWDRGRWRRRAMSGRTCRRSATPAAAT